MKKVFIDGSAGTTGLKIHDRLSGRSDIELIILPDSLRKDDGARAQAINASDITFLCLPDAAAVDAVGMVKNPDTVIIDTSTAHRTNDDFAYGFAELSQKHFDKIRSSKRIAVPGCHASGFIALVQPLVSAGIIKPDANLSCTSVTGYSGGGKQMIAQYESADLQSGLKSPRQYAITQNHKHLKEMSAVTGLDNPPVFMPFVADFYSGMEVTVPLHRLMLCADVCDIKNIYKKTYTGPVVNFNDGIDENGFIPADALSGKDSMQITVAGNDQRILLIARYDNLGKGASGAALQCFNIVTGCDMTRGLVL